ncbi:hypothetical protein [Acaryochloris sp. CCMEE 5410]|uniref:hypothetical protein n=1 Tax=Acaryochloris sp. CCMEE 5410 TaxID=310037 RepID=UPI0003147625|nr:hypothetical protein [Acaryochloris sp. CCMEE 5410]KAI9129916.1 hypothetical protein ON05_030070 [Acaryochloris sp. CCMEE 5410]KAI9130208.1 hypothetical protein ON05_031790 [Acaryochloris sp. CCMEE 5410]
MTPFDYELAKGNLISAINLAIQDANQALDDAENAITNLNKRQLHIHHLAQNALNKFQRL